MLTGYGLMKLRGASARLLRSSLRVRKSGQCAPRIGRETRRASWISGVTVVFLATTAFLAAPSLARATDTSVSQRAVVSKAQASTKPLTDQERHLGIAAICLATQELANNPQGHDPLKLAQSLAEKFHNASPRMDWVVSHLLTLYKAPAQAPTESVKSTAAAPVTEQAWNEDDCPPPGAVYGLAAPLPSGEIGKVFARDMSH